MCVDEEPGLVWEGKVVVLVGQVGVDLAWEECEGFGDVGVV